MDKEDGMQCCMSLYKDILYIVSFSKQAKRVPHNCIVVEIFGNFEKNVLNVLVEKKYGLGM